MTILVSKGVLKNKMLEYFRQVEKSREELIVTDNNRPVLRVIPYFEKLDVNTVFQKHRGKVQYYDDITNDSSQEWEKYL